MATSERLNRETEVNLLAAAREAQWSAPAFMGSHTMKIVAPAKVNLQLAIGDRRADGYHDADTIMHALALHDTVYVHCESVSADEVARSASALETAEATVKEAAETSGLPDGPVRGLSQAQALLATCAVGGPAENLLVEIDFSDRTGRNMRLDAEENLAFRAADALARALGREDFERVRLRIEKLIPAQAGLGGGSSNAAAVLVGLAQAWGIKADDDRVMSVAQSLGADVAFFLRGGCARLSGVGDCFEAALTPSSRAVVLVKPDAGVSTGAAYRCFDKRPVGVPGDVLKRNAQVNAADEVVLANNLAFAAETLLPELKDIRLWLAEKVGEQNVLLSGSGSATFAIVETFAQASALATAALARGWWARPTGFSPLRAAMVPAR